MDRSLLIQMLGSALAVGGLVALAAWARIARPTPALDPQAGRDLLTQEFPGQAIDGLWIAADGAGLVARSGDQGLVLWRKGDGYVARQSSWTRVMAATADKGRLRLKLDDVAPRLALGDGAWPPAHLMPSSPAR